MIRKKSLRSLIEISFSERKFFWDWCKTLVFFHISDKFAYSTSRSKFCNSWLIKTMNYFWKLRNYRLGIWKYFRTSVSSNKKGSPPVSQFRRNIRTKYTTDLTTLTSKFSIKKLHPEQFCVQFSCTKKCPIRPSLKKHNRVFWGK